MADDVVNEEETTYEDEVIELLESIEWLLYSYVKHTVGYDEKPTPDPEPDPDPNPNPDPESDDS